jgi:hypothetical protein
MIKEKMEEKFLKLLFNTADIIICPYCGSTSSVTMHTSDTFIERITGTINVILKCKCNKKILIEYSAISCELLNYDEWESEKVKLNIDEYKHDLYNTVEELVQLLMDNGSDFGDLNDKTEKAKKLLAMVKGN